MCSVCPSMLSALLVGDYTTGRWQLAADTDFASPATQSRLGAITQCAYSGRVGQEMCRSSISYNDTDGPNSASSTLNVIYGALNITSVITGNTSAPVNGSTQTIGMPSRPCVHCTC